VSIVLVQSHVEGWLILKGDAAPSELAHSGDAQGAGIGQAYQVGTSIAHPAEPGHERDAPRRTHMGGEQPTAAVWFDREHSTSGPITKVATSVAQWARAHPNTVDTIVALGLFALAIFSTRLSQASLVEGQAIVEKIRPSAEAAVRLGGEAAVGGRETLRILEEQPQLPRIGWLYFLGGLSTLPLMVRRRFPDVVHPLIFSGFALTLWVFPLDVQIASLTAWLSAYSYAAYAKANTRVRNLVLTITGSIVVLVLTGIVRNRKFDYEPLMFRKVIFYLLLTVVLYGAPVIFGLVMRRHYSTLDQLQARTQTLQIQQLTLQQQQADLERTAILNERVRIARELHDVVAHHVSVMGMQAGAARLTLGTNDTPVAKALGSIEQSSREAVANLQQLLGFLRSGQNAGEHDAIKIARPQPGLDGLPLLIEEHRGAGYLVSANISHDAGSVQPGVALSGYRIVQEALTNIRKHAHRGDETTVAVLVNGDVLHIEVTNKPPAGSAKNTPSQPLTDTQNSGAKLATKYLTGRTAAGLGLRGMKERVELHSGQLNTGATVDGGFSVEASLRGARAGKSASSRTINPNSAASLSTTDSEFN
jgi:signal transduction histidine kinase